MLQEKFDSPSITFNFYSVKEVMDTPGTSG